MVLPIGDEDDDTAVLAPRRERRSCERNGTAERGTLFGDHIGRYLRHEVAGRQIIGRNGKLHVGVPCEDDDAHLILLQPLQHLFYGIFGTFEPVGFEIAGQHGVGDIDRYHYLHPFALHLPEFGTELRTGHRHCKQRQRRQKKHRLVAHTRRRSLRHEFCKRLRIAETLQPSAARPNGKQIHRRQQRYRRQQVQIIRNREFQHLLSICFYPAVLSADPIASPLQKAPQRSSSS